jgi:tetratricopeptide (TPR) repeat protein
MKKGILSSIFLVLHFASNAQMGEVTNAILALKDGVIADAQTSIDKAIVHEKTSKETKTWLYKGKVYEAVALDPTLGKQNPDAAKIAFDAYKKAQELDAVSEKPGKFKKDIESALSGQNLASALQNSGIIAYQNKNLALSYECFTMFQEVKPKDTLGYVYAAQMALAQDKYPDAKTAYINCIEKTGYITEDIITNLVYIFKTVESEKNYEKALEYVKIGRTKYPTNQNFITQEADLLEKTNKLPEAIAGFENLIKTNPTTETYLVLGSLYEKNKQLDKAKEMYSNALAKNPESFEANYNMGAILFNPAVEIIKEVRNMGVADYNKKGKQMETQAKEILTQSLPYFEKASKIKPDDESIKRTLKEINSNIGKK